MMTLHQLYERAYKEHIEIDIVEMLELSAVSFPEGWIAIDRRRYKDDTEFKCDLAHEIGHIETGAFYNICSPYELRERCEHKADRRAVGILMPWNDVNTALHRGHNTAAKLAEYFDVTLEFAEMALEMYEEDIIKVKEHEQLAAVFAAHGIHLTTKGRRSGYL